MRRAHTYKSLFVGAVLLVTLALAPVAVADYSASPGAIKYAKKSHPCGPEPANAVTVFDLQVHKMGCGTAFKALNTTRARKTISYKHHMRLLKFSCKFHAEYRNGTRAYGFGWYLCRKGKKFFIFKPWSDSGL